MQPVSLPGRPTHLLRRAAPVLAFLIILAGSAAAQSISIEPIKTKTQRFPETLARAAIERDSLMNLPRRYTLASAGKRSEARRRALAQRRLEERRASRLAVDYVARPVTLAAMSYPADEGDSLALLALYQSTDGFSWKDKANWLTGPVSTWAGIEVNAEGRVTTIDLEDNGLFGSLPSQIQNLTELQFLDLSDNFVLGAVPNSIGALTKLEVLDLSNNALSGGLPTSVGDMEALVRLVLWSNNLGGALPTSLAGLANLEEIWLFDNKMEGAIPEELGNLTSLTRLYLDQNKFSGAIPASLSMLENLIELFLDFNQLTGEIPADLSQLANLKVFFAGNNDLEGEIPVELGDLTSLWVLSLPNNRLTGPIPESLSFYPSLTQLDLSGNELIGGIPSGLEMLYTLTELYLADNQLTGTISSGFGLNLFNLGDLDLSGNQFSGPVPESIGFLGNLKYLDLSANQFSGELPLLIDDQRLRWVYLNDNQFSGSITQIFDSQQLLQELDLSNNDFSGEIPASMGTHLILERLILSENNFTGPLPAGIKNLAYLRVLDLWYNDFSGLLPPEFGKLQALQLADLGSNNFSGALPADLGDLSSLVFFLLDENQFSGAVPESFLQLDVLFGLTMKNNLLTGLPDLSLLSSLDTLDVSGNRFTFEDIEPIVDAAGGAVSYAPQAPVETRVDEIGGQIRYEVEVGGSANGYQWFRAGQPIADQTDPILTLDASPVDPDSIHAEITNSIATALTLTSIPVRHDARLTRIEIEPDSVMLASGDSVRFAYQGYDQFDTPRFFTGVWSATGGVIDEMGLFVAGDTSGVYSVFVFDLSGQLRGEAVAEIEGIVDTAVEPERPAPVDFALHGAYPNPFTGQARIAFDLPSLSPVTLRVFDVLGREVAVLAEGIRPAGRHEVVLEADAWPSGIYFYTLQAGEFRAARSVVHGR